MFKDNERTTKNVFKLLGFVSSKNQETFIVEFLINNANHKECVDILKRRCDLMKIFEFTNNKTQVLLLNQAFSFFKGKLNILSFIEENNLQDKRLLIQFLKNSENFSQEDLLRIINLIPNDESSNIEILTLIFNFNKKNATSNAIKNIKETEITENSTIFKNIVSKNLINLVNVEILEKKTSEKGLIGFVGTFSNLLIPHFISMIKGLNDLFIEPDLNPNLLKNIVGYVGLENFLEIIDYFDPKKHWVLIKGISNSDISTFFNLLDKCDNEESSSYIIRCLPDFYNYATDSEFLIDRLLDFLVDLFEYNNILASSALDKEEEEMIY